MPLTMWSTVTLLTELAVTASVYFIIWKAYRTGIFMRLFAFLVLAYEVLFNISYMLSREMSPHGTTVYNPYQTTLAIFHGTFSLVMFVTLILFFLRAARAYKNGTNYFLLHRRLTLTFATAWGISILSGITFFVTLYVF